MKIMVCVKHVVDTTEVRIDPTTGAPALRGVPTKISDYDKNAVEAAVSIKAAAGAEVIVAGIGPKAAVKTLKEAVAMGADSALLATVDEGQALDAVTTATVLAALAGAHGPFDLILCGEVSEDGYNAQVGPALAELLGIAHIAYVEQLTAAADGVRAVREVDGQLEEIAGPYPVLLTVNRKLNKPRLPTAIQVLKVQATRIKEVRLADLDLAGDLLSRQPTSVIAYRPVSMARKGVMVEGEPAAAAQQLATLLRQEGVLA